MKNIINIEYYRMTLRFEVRNVKVERFKGRRGNVIDEYALIILINKENNREMPHPLSSFIYELWRHTSYNNQLSRAKHITQFLNYILFTCNSIFNLKSLSDLNVKHGVYYLEHKIEEGCSRKTLDSYDSTITHFYQYLAHKKYLKHIKESDFVYQTNLRNNKKTLKSFFISEITSLPTYPIEDTKIRTLEEHHVIPFLKTAHSVADDIALGIYLSFFGGLRGSEVVSIKRSEIKKLGVFGEHGLIVKLKTDKRFAKGSGNRVKSPGSQAIDAVSDLLKQLYRFHLEKYPTPIDGSDSLFVNKHSTAMQYQTYNSRFNKVKDAFIERLRNSDNPDDKLYALQYQSLKWSTHIGRGTYSNNIAEECTHIIQIMRARRDKSPESVSAYLINTKKSINNINNALEDLFEGGDKND